MTASPLNAPPPLQRPTGYPKAADGCCHKTVLVGYECSDCPFHGAEPQPATVPRNQ